MYDTTPHALGSRSRPTTPIVWDSIEGSLLQRFNSHFKTLPADMPEHILQAQRIRYQVYCVENPLETTLDNPEGIETDEFDAHAVHSLLIARETGAALGTVRLIMPLPSAPERSFALQRLLDASSLKVLLSLPVSSLAEVSRFSISRHFRRLMTYSPESDSHAVVVEQFRPADAAWTDSGTGTYEHAARNHALVRAHGANAAAHARRHGDSLQADRPDGRVSRAAPAVLHQRSRHVGSSHARAPCLLGDDHGRRDPQGLLRVRLARGPVARRGPPSRAFAFRPRQISSPLRVWAPRDAALQNGRSRQIVARVFKRGFLP